MKNHISWLLLILLIFIFPSAAVAQRKILSLPVTSDQLSKYIAKDEEMFSFYLSPEYEKQRVKFTPQDIAKSPQGGSEWGAPPDTTTEYFEVGHFHINDFLYKLIIYETDAMNTFSVLKIQLNTYAPNGDLKDAVILDFRFGYEENEFFSKFTLDENVISINHYRTQIYDLEAPEGEEKIKNPIPELYIKARYRIDNGIFKLIYWYDKDHPPKTEKIKERWLSFPITQNHLNRYLFKYEDSFAFHIRPEYKNELIYFTPLNIPRHLRGMNVSDEAPDYLTEYFEAGRFYQGKFLYKLILYKSYESPLFDTFNVQLNSYDENGLLLDGILLENRYEFENVRHFTSFAINSDEIFIYYYAANAMATEQGKKINGLVENPVPELFGHARYKIDNGHFKLIYKTDKIKDGSE